MCPTKKKLINVPADLIAKLNKASNEAGKAFYEYIAENLEQALRAHNLGHPLKEIVDFYELMDVQKTAGSVVIPRETLNYLIQELYPTKGEQLRKRWMDAGEWYGKYLQTKLQDKDPVEAFGKLMTVSQWDLNEFELKKEGDTVTLRCVSFLLSKENTELLMSFVEGVMNSLGYEVRGRDYVRGMVSIKFLHKKP